MSRSAPDRLRDIIAAADLAARHAGNLAAGELAVTPGARDATLYCLTVVCEAASRLPAELKALAPEIPWSQVRDTRNYLVHSYWQIDFRIIVDTVAYDLGPLQAAAERLLSMLQADRP